MPNEIPAGIEVEPGVRGRGDLRARRGRNAAPGRPQHLTRIADLMRKGIVTEAGGYADLSTALLFVRAVDEAAALAIARDDVYMREGIWVEFRVKPFGRVELSGGG